MENVTKTDYWLIPPYTDISKCTDSQMMAKESEFHGQSSIGDLFALNFLYSSSALRPQSGFILFLFCKRRIKPVPTTRIRYILVTQCKPD